MTKRVERNREPNFSGPNRARKGEHEVRSLANLVSSLAYRLRVEERNLPSLRSRVLPGKDMKPLL